MPSSKLTRRICGAVVLAVVLVFFLLLCRPDPAREGVSRIPFMPMSMRTSPERTAKMTGDGAHSTPLTPKFSLTAGAQLSQDHIFPRT
jgi:hypothetical protein